MGSSRKPRLAQLLALAVRDMGEAPALAWRHDVRPDLMKLLIKDANVNKNKPGWARGKLVRDFGGSAMNEFWAGFVKQAAREKKPGFARWAGRKIGRTTEQLRHTSIGRALQNASANLEAGYGEGLKDARKGKK